MTPFKLVLLGAATAALTALTPLAIAQAQPTDAAAVVAVHADMTLKQREDWLDGRLDKARDDRSLDHGEYLRVRRELGRITEDERQMRAHHDDQLTDNQTTNLEARLDAVADKIHWLHENSFQRPW